MALKMKEVRSFLYKIRMKWYNIGIELDFETAELDAIKTAPAEGSDPHLSHLTKMITQWIKSGRASWNALSTALKAQAIGERLLADEG